MARIAGSSSVAYGRIRHQLEKSGSAIGPKDLVIGAIALTNNFTLVTHNTTEFGGIPLLAMEDWQS